MCNDENYTSFVVSLPVHKMGGGEGAIIQGGEGTYLKFWPIGGALFRSGRFMICGGRSFEDLRYSR